MFSFRILIKIKGLIELNFFQDVCGWCNSPNEYHTFCVSHAENLSPTTENNNLRNKCFEKRFRRYTHTVCTSLKKCSRFTYNVKKIPRNHPFYTTQLLSESIRPETRECGQWEIKEVCHFIIFKKKHYVFSTERCFINPRGVSMHNPSARHVLFSVSDSDSYSSSLMAGVQNAVSDII